MRARTSWSHYPQSTQAQLHVESLDPTTLDVSLSENEGHPYLRPGIFIIANHADELTPWTPVLATLSSASGYLSIPCCAWTFDERYERARTQDYPVADEDFVESLYLGGDGSNSSSYSRYRIWLASLSLHCGWQVETETLRIPSTRNWAIVGRTHASFHVVCSCNLFPGRKRVAADGESGDVFRRRVEDIVRHVRERGLFKTRPPEGKAKEH